MHFIQVMGILRVLCEVTKLGSAEQVRDHQAQFLQFAEALEGSDSQMANTVIRKLRTKLIARIAIRLLPGRARRLRAKGTYSPFDCVAIDSPNGRQGVCWPRVRTVQS